jgi:hypothetical protein
MKAIGAKVNLVERQQVEDDQRGGCLDRQPLDPTLRRVNALAEQVEVEPVGRDDDHLAVDDAAAWKLGADRVDQLGEVTGERLLASGAELHLVAVAKDHAAVAVPLRLVQQPIGLGHRRRRPGQHRLDRRHHRQLHLGLPSATGSRKSYWGAQSAL